HPLTREDLAALSSRRLALVALISERVRGPRADDQHGDLWQLGHGPGGGALWIRDANEIWIRLPGAGRRRFTIEILPAQAIGDSPSQLGMNRVVEPRILLARVALTHRFFLQRTQNADELPVFAAPSKPLIVSLLQRHCEVARIDERSPQH